jgi:hypothetical protein
MLIQHPPRSSVSGASQRSTLLGPHRHDVGARRRLRESETGAAASKRWTIP